MWAQSSMGIIACGHRHVWTQPCLRTIVSAHNHVWAQSCGHVVWTRSYMGTNVVELTDFKFFLAKYFIYFLQVPVTHFLWTVHKANINSCCEGFMLSFDSIFTWILYNSDIHQSFLKKLIFFRNCSEWIQQNRRMHGVFCQVIYHNSRKSFSLEYITTSCRQSGHS